MRAAIKDEIKTYFQSPGPLFPDDAAREAARDDCDGFWCPYLPDGAVESPMPPQPFAGPQIAFVQKGTLTPMCLSGTCRRSFCAVTVVPCKGMPRSIRWVYADPRDLNGTSGRTTSSRIPRIAFPQGSSDDWGDTVLRMRGAAHPCASNEAAVVGPFDHNNVFYFDERARQFRTEACAGFCLAVQPLNTTLHHRVRVRPCTHATKWTAVTVT